MSTIGTIQLKEIRKVKMNYSKDKHMETKTKIQAITYSRVSGYYAPLSQFNLGKQEEYKNRQTVNVPAIAYRASTRDFAGV